jgi:phospholipid/cholesterol/gamma-HCH transport system permease protein
VVQSLGAASLFAVEALAVTLFRDFSLRKILAHIYEIGVKTTPLILMVGFFSGLVLGLQGYFSLIRFGSEALLGSLVALTIIREVGPVFAAVMIVGQAGSAMAAEIGVQRNSEQIDALKIMGIRPLAFLIGPRLIAAAVVFPIQTALFNSIGIWGGHVSAVEILGIDNGVYWSSIRTGVFPTDIYGSILKASVFGLLTITVCCFEGFFTHERAFSKGARGVSESATRAVVISSVLILLSDYIITSLIL